MKKEKKVIMKRDWKVIKEILLSIENNREFNTDEVSRDKELIAYNYDILLNKQYITNYGSKELSKSSSIEDLMCVVEYIEEKSSLTFDGHELLDCLRSKLFTQVKEELEKMGIEGSIDMVKRVTEKLVEQKLEETFKLK